MNEQKAAPSVNKSKSRLIKEKQYAKAKIKKKKQKERLKRELKLRQSGHALSKNSSLYVLGNVSAREPIQKAESDPATISSRSSPETQDDPQVDVPMDSDCTGKAANAIGTSTKTTPQRSKSGPLPVAPSHKEVQMSTYTLFEQFAPASALPEDANTGTDEVLNNTIEAMGPTPRLQRRMSQLLDTGKGAPSAFFCALKSISAKSATAAERQEGDHMARPPSVSVIADTDIPDKNGSPNNISSGTETYSLTDRTFLEIQEMGTRVKRIGTSLRFYEDEVNASLRIRKPYRGSWFLYSTEFYNLWRKAVAQEDIWDHPGLLVQRIKGEKGKDRQPGSVHRHRVKVAIVLGKAEYMTEQFELPMYNTDPPVLLRTYEQQNGEEGISFDVEVFFLGKGYMELHIPSEVVTDAVGGGLEDHAAVDTGKRMVFYGVQAAAVDGE